MELESSAKHRRRPQRRSCGAPPTMLYQRARINVHAAELRAALRKKNCTGCGQTFPLSEFSSSDCLYCFGKRSKCKGCYTGNCVQAK